MIRGFALALGLFAAFFALHIVGGATDQGWLFATAVALIFLTATGFPAIMHAFAGRRARMRHARALWLVGGIAGVALTSSALWAANDRTIAWWQAPAALLLVGVISPALWVILRQKVSPTTTRRVISHSASSANAASQATATPR